MFGAESLYSHANWAEPSKMFSILATLRREDPVHFCESKTHPDLWHITKHADLLEVEKLQDKFLANPRMLLATREGEAQVQQMTGGSRNLVETLICTDQPDHRKLRTLTQAWFMPRNLGRLQTEIERSATLAIDQFIEHNGECDFARDVALEFPLRVIMTVLGVPQKDLPLMVRFTQELFSAEDPDARRADLPEGADATQLQIATLMEYAKYFQALTEARKTEPGQDIASIIANETIDGAPLTEAQRLGYYTVIATAGHDTTSYSLDEAIRQLALNPELLARLKSAPEEMAPRIAEEAIRIAAPVRHFIRTASEDYSLRGKTIKKGQSVILWFPSGSRDEALFDNAEAFDPDRANVRAHTSFGHAAHVCLGMNLARMEIATFLRLLVQRIDSICLTGEPAYAHSNFIGGIKRLPVRATLSA